MTCPTAPTPPPPPPPPPPPAPGGGGGRRRPLPSPPPQGGRERGRCASSTSRSRHSLRRTMAQISLDHARVGSDLLRPAFGDHLAFGQHEDVLGEAHHGL